LKQGLQNRSKNVDFELHFEQDRKPLVICMQFAAPRI